MVHSILTLLIISTASTQQYCRVQCSQSKSRRRRHVSVLLTNNVICRMSSLAAGCCHSSLHRVVFLYSRDTSNTDLVFCRWSRGG